MFHKFHNDFIRDQLRLRFWDIRFGFRVSDDVPHNSRQAGILYWISQPLQKLFTPCCANILKNTSKNAKSETRFHFHDFFPFFKNRYSYGVIFFSHFQAHQITASVGIIILMKSWNLELHESVILMSRLLARRMSTMVGPIAQRIQEKLTVEFNPSALLMQFNI